MRRPAERINDGGYAPRAGRDSCNLSRNVKQRPILTEQNFSVAKSLEEREIIRHVETQLSRAGGNLGSGASRGSRTCGLSRHSRPHAKGGGRRSTGSN